MEDSHEELRPRDRTAAAPGGGVGKSSQPKEKVFGPVTVLDARTHSLRVMNTPVKLRPDATVWKTPSQ